MTRRDNLGRFLRLLHCQLERDWTTLSNNFSLPEHVSAETFWVRFWQVCVSYALRDHTHPIRRVLLSRSCGISQLISKRKAIPTGLPEPFNGLVKLSGIKWKTAGLLADEKRWLRCSKLEWFPSEFAPGTIVNSKVADDLYRFVKPEIDHVPALRLTIAIETLLAQTPCMNPEIAAKVGVVLDKDLLPEFDWTGDAVSARAKLGQAIFRTKAGTERRAFGLRIMRGGRLENAEEWMRASCDRKLSVRFAKH